MTSNILAEVIQTRDTVTGDEFREMLQAVDGKVSQIKTDLVESLQSVFVLHDTDIDKVTTWYVEIKGVSDKVHELERQFHEDKKALLSANDDIDCLSEELEYCDKNISLLETLVKVITNLERADPTDYFRASQLLDAAQRDFRVILDAFGTGEDHDWVTGIRSQISDLTTDIYEKASKDFASMFQFGVSKLTVNVKFDVDRLLKTFLNIGYCSRVMNKLAANIWQELLSKACSQDHLIEITGKTKPTAVVPGTSRFDADGDSDTIPVRDIDPQRYSPGDYTPKHLTSGLTVTAVKIPTPLTKLENVFTNIRNVLAIFHETFAENPDVMEEIAGILAPKICVELGNKCLKNLILRSANGNLEQAKANVNTMNRFIEDFANNLNFTFPPDSIFDDLERDFDELFLAQVTQDLLVKIRKLIKSNLHDIQETDCENPAENTPMSDEAALHKNPAAFPCVVVSKSVIEIVNVLKAHLKRYPDDIAMCDATFNLYLALVKVPKHESESGDLAPFSAVLVHNNCMYLAYHASFTFPMSEDKVPELRSKGTQAYSFMIRSVRTKLNSMIYEAMTRINDNDESSDADVTHFLRISAEFIHFHGLFKTALPPSTLNRALATLVDHTVNEMCSKVLSWDDISATCSNNLASAFTQFAVETSDLFKGDATNTREIEAFAAKSISKWNRFRMLTFVLTASMKEIEDKWVEGCGPLAMEFKAEELRKLVRALFQNTDRRAAFLASIK